MKTKFYICLFYISLIFSICILPNTFATSDVSNIVEDNLKIETLDYDLFISEQSSVITNEVSGNVFALTDNFTISDTGVINGNLYIISNAITLKSTVNYSDEISKDGTNLISSVDSYASINGSVFAISQDFILEPGTEINGDLYILSPNITIDKSCSIYGSVFTFGEDIAINGKISGSVYASSTNFSMSYFGSISNDLNVDATDITLNNVIHRDANITCDNLLTSSSFLVYGNLNADAKNTVFSGQVSGDATFNSKYLNFKTEENGISLKCKILGNLNYSSLEELEIPESIASKEVTFSKYSENKDSESATFLEIFKDFITSLLTFLVYILVVCLLIKFVVPNYLNNDEVSIADIFKSLAIGLITIIAFFILFMALLLTSFTTILSFVLLFGYILLCFIGLPIFVLNIVKTLKSSINNYILILLISAGLFVISYLNIPVLSVLVMFLALNTGVGAVILKCFKRKS